MKTRKLTLVEIGEDSNGSFAVFTGWKGCSVQIYLGDSFTLEAKPSFKFHVSGGDDDENP